MLQICLFYGAICWTKSLKWQETSALHLIVEQEAIHAETQAFWAMHDELLRTYPGQYVALYQSNVVDHDEDVSRLEKRVRERFGLLPVLVAPVKPGQRRDLRWLGGRIEGIA